MLYRVEFTKQALRDFRDLDRPRRKRLMDAVEGLAKDPYPPGSKRLRNNLCRYHRIREEADRAIYLVDEKSHEVLVVVVGHRRSVYVSAGRRLR